MFVVYVVFVGATIVLTRSFMLATRDVSVTGQETKMISSRLSRALWEQKALIIMSHS